MSYDRRRLRGHHPPACTCVNCVERKRRGPARQSPRAPFRSTSRASSAGRQRGTGGQPSLRMPSNFRQARPRDEANGPFAILRRWVILIAVVLGITFVILYLTNSGPFAPPGVYTVLLWGNLGGGVEIIGEYPIFHQTSPPSGYVP